MKKKLLSLYTLVVRSLFSEGYVFVKLFFRPAIFQLKSSVGLCL